MHFGAAEVERLGDLRLGLRVDAAKRRLNIVQDRQQRPFAAHVLRNNFVEARFVAQKTTTLRMLSPACISSNALLISSSFST